MTTTTEGRVNPLAVLDADLRYTEQRLAKHRRKADADAAKRGERQAGADRHCEWVEYVRASKRAARDVVAELLAAGNFMASNPNGTLTPGALERWKRAAAPFSEGRE